MKTILIAGGTGLIGKHLIQLLVSKGFAVKLLSRNSASAKKENTYFWDYSNGIIQAEALENVTILINLCGDNISTGRWTSKKRQQILDSRIETTNFLYKEIKKRKINLEVYISASAIGFYGMVSEETIFTETHKAGTDFLAEVCAKWENAAKQFATLNIRTCIMRIGVVLAQEGGALPKLLKMARNKTLAIIGNGKQIVPWIHIEDLCQIILYSLQQNQIQGIYNCVSPNNISNKEFTKQIAAVSKQRIILPNVPNFILKLLYGEMSGLLTHGSQVSAQKIQATGYNFRYSEIQAALEAIIHPEK